VLSEIETTPRPGTRGGEHSYSPGCRAPLMTFASRNHSAVGDDRPPIYRHTGGRPSSVAGMPRIAYDIRITEPRGGQEWPPSHLSPHGRAVIIHVH